jgi:hypothetical protein
MGTPPAFIFGLYESARIQNKGLHAPNSILWV